MATTRCIDCVQLPCGLQFRRLHQSPEYDSSSHGRANRQKYGLQARGGILELAGYGLIYDRWNRCSTNSKGNNYQRRESWGRYGFANRDSSNRRCLETNSTSTERRSSCKAGLDTSLASNSETQGNEGKEVQGLKALDAYFDKLKPKEQVPEPVEQIVPTVAETTTTELTEEEQFLKTLMETKQDYENYQASVKEQAGRGSTSETSDLKFQVTSNNDADLSNWELPEEQGSSSNLINILVAINIAVYLFGLASPHEAHGITDSSLPVVYGAKVNELMRAGQWWRFITPMFLHASLLHVSLSSWALLSFGPVVESAYGTIGFAMIYFLGGLFGDLTSFFHTSEWTVGGTGPIYALVGTWVVYLLKNREVIGRGIADDMIRKVVILSAVNVALCNSLPIDDGTHLGAVLFGVFFGILASPTMQMNVAVKDMSTQKEDDDAAAYLWFNSVTSPLRLGLIFTLCLGIFLVIYQLTIGGFDDFFFLQDSELPL